MTARPVLGLSFRRKRGSPLLERTLDTPEIFKSTPRRSSRRKSFLGGKKYSMKEKRRKSNGTEVDGNERSKSDVRRRSSRFMLGVCAIGKAADKFKQKLRMTTLRRKRNRTVAPMTPMAQCVRRSLRLSNKTPSSDTKLYTPFAIETPENTPLRLGIIPKRFNFTSSPDFRRDLDTVSEGLKTLTDISNTVSASMISQGKGIDNCEAGDWFKTPEARRLHHRRPRIIMGTSSARLIN